MKIMSLFDAEKFTEFDTNVVEIFSWYDRHTRDYCIQKLNKERFQVGDSIRVGDKKSKDLVVNELKLMYNID